MTPASNFLGVMPTLVAGIRVFAAFQRGEAWMAGDKPGHDS